VAATAGVSTATVSRVFSKPHLLRESTVAHVKEVASRLGYVPHHTAQALSTGRLGTIAVVVPDIANPFFPPVIRAAQAHAYASGISTLLGDTDEDPANEATLLATVEQRTDGVVLVSSRLPEEVIRRHAQRRPLVLVNRDISGVARVLVDSAAGVREAVDHLAALGHRHVVYVSGPDSSWSNQQRRDAVREQCAARGILATILRPHRPEHDAGRAATSEILESDATAAIAFDDAIAQGILAGMAERGLAVPDDLSVIGCDDILAATTYPPLTTVRSRGGDVGRLAVEMLLELVENRARPDDADHPARRHAVTSSLITRATTGPPPVPPASRGISARESGN
jgi:DNA-binding LacI/PurR family transcriptional regulator